ncbi:hypothetical protein DFH27DRAFT_395193 [Peziza echinospora]|nr:hypothetical protein DFH27DRAFT_395193 [Peziza echinospora]
MSLLHPRCPQWFLSQVASKLSTLPIRRAHAIRHILQLFLSTPTTTSQANQQHIGGTPDISLDAIAKASKLIGSFPRSVTPDEWFRIVVPQLFELMRGEGGNTDDGLKRASAYVVAELLSKNGIDEVIEREIVKPLLVGLDPEYGQGQGKDIQTGVPKPKEIVRNTKKATKTSQDLLSLENTETPLSAPSPFKSLISVIDEDEASSNFEEETEMEAIVPENMLMSTLTTLALLLNSHPTPLIPEKLLKPVLLPLWGLMCTSKERKKSTEWIQLSNKLLVSYIKAEGAGITPTPTSMKDKTPIESILYNIGFIGGEGWEFGNGAEGGLEIRKKGGKDGKGALGMEEVDGRVLEFMNLIKEVGGDDEGQGKIIAGLFLHILNDWLGIGGGGQNRQEDPVRILIRLKILQQILTNHADSLGKNPTETLQVIKNILDEFVSSRSARHQTTLHHKSRTSAPSLSGLGNIVDSSTSASISPIKRQQQQQGRRYAGDTDDEDNDEAMMDESAALESSEESDSMERMSITLSLLSSMLANPATEFTEQDERLLQTLKPALEYLSTASADVVDPSISSLAVNISSFISLFTPEDVRMAGTEGAAAAGGKNTQQPSLAEQHKATYKTALSYLSDPLVPIRAHGLYLLRQLILSRSPILDIPVTLRLLVSMIKDTDSYVYLNVVKCLQSLSEKHAGTVIGLLVENYMDDSGGKSLDERLRLGEALLGTVEKEGKMLVGEVAQTVAQGMIDVVSRRRRREEKRGDSMGVDGGIIGDEVKETIEAMKPPKNPFREEDDSEEEEEEEEEEGELADLDETGAPLPKETKLLRNHHLAIIKNWLPPPGTQLEDIRIRASALSILSAAVETNPLGVGPRLCEVTLEIALAILQLEGTPEKAILRRAAMICLAGLLKGWDNPSAGGGGGWLRGRLDTIKIVVGYVQGVDGDGLVRDQARRVVEIVDDVRSSVLMGGMGGASGSSNNSYHGIGGPAVIGEIGLEGLGRRWG